MGKRSGRDPWNGWRSDAHGGSDCDDTDATVHPEDAGLPAHPFESILGGTPADNARAFRDLMDGAEGGYRDAVLLNSAAALVVIGKASDLKAGVEMARESLDSGAAKARIDALAEATKAGCRC